MTRAFLLSCWMAALAVVLCGQTAGPTPRWSSAYTFTADTALTGHTATYDQVNKVMTIFGGSSWGNGLNYTNAVLLYSPANGSGSFSTLIPNGTAGSPAARALHTAVYDRTTNHMIVFGGTAQNQSSLFNDVWILTHANGVGGTPAWIQLNPAGTPPAPRYSHTAVYDAKDNRMIVYGGFGGGSLADVWVLSHANGAGGTPAWTQLTPGGTPPDGTVYDTAVYDPVNDIMMVFGGEIASGIYSNQVTALSHASGLAGTPQWTVVTPEGAVGSPSPRTVSSAVYDVTNNRMVVFGGGESSGIRARTGLNDTWVLSSANGLGGTPAWTPLKPSGAIPGARLGQTAVYDSATNQLMVFAGQNSEAAYYTVWVLSHPNGI